MGGSIDSVIPLDQRGLLLSPLNHSAVQAVQEEMAALTDRSDSDKLSGDDKRVLEDLSIIGQLYHLADFVLVGLGDFFDNASLCAYARPAHTPVYVKLTQEQLLRLIMRAAKLRSTPRSISGNRARQVLETFIHRPEILSAINRDIIMVSEGLFFDKTKPAGEELTSSIPGDRRCFFKLFDTSAPDKDIIKYPDSTFSSSFSKKVRSAYDSLLSALEELAPNPTDPFPKASLSATCEEEDPLPRHFPFIEQWANHNPGLYWDLMTIPATVFLEEKPSVSFFLSGSSANGKSKVMSSTPVFVNRRGQIIRSTQGTLAKGDYVLTPRGEWAEVVDPMVHPTTTDPCYKVTLRDGRSVVATYDHIWTVVSKDHLTGHHPRVRDQFGRPTEKRQHIPLTGYDPEMWETRRTDELLADLSLSKPKYWYMPPTAPAPFPERSLPIDPYTLGVILGDGHISWNGRSRINVTVTGQDPELLTLFGNIREEKRETRKSPTGVKNYAASTNLLSDGLTSLGLIPPCRSYEKFIPPEYLIASIEQRKALLAGILDTDGSVNPLINQLEFSTTSRQLAKDVKELVFSLGGTATETERDGHYTQNGERHEARHNYRLSIRTSFNPFRLPRKASLWKKPKRLGYVRIKSITPVPSVPCNCISVKDPDGSPENQHTYLVGNYVPTHNCYLGLIHTLLGTNNTTRVKLSGMNKWHLNTQLQYTLFNAPDDEGDSISDEAAEFFKSIASHGTITLPIMRSQKPMQLNADFISAHPMNAFPEWSGTTSSSALTRRTCLIPFTADFRDAPPTSPTGNFARDTFTPDVIARFTGEVLALASFYSSRPIIWSSATREMQQQIKEENESARLYRQEFDKYFDGFQSLGLAYDDYKCWCKAKGITKIGTQGELRIQFTGFMGDSGRSTARLYKRGEPASDEKGAPIYSPFYRNPDKKTVDKLRKERGEPRRIAMLDDTTLPPPFDEYGSISAMHHIDSLDKAVGETSYSAVHLMELYYGD